MPTYEYECTQCLCHFELRRSFSEDSIVTCPRCGSETHLILSPVPVIFKGSGFYTTDNRTQSKNEPREDKPKAEAN